MATTANDLNFDRRTRKLIGAVAVRRKPPLAVR
jgi:hypothetical protein